MELKRECSYKIKKTGELRKKFKPRYKKTKTMFLNEFPIIQSCQS